MSGDRLRGFGRILKGCSSLPPAGGFGPFSALKIVFEIKKGMTVFDRPLLVDSPTDDL
jgi:hypothetical protein